MNTLDDLDIEVVVEEDGKDMPVSKLEEVTLDALGTVPIVSGPHRMLIDNKPHCLYQDNLTNDPMNRGKMVVEDPDGNKDYNSSKLGRAIISYVNNRVKSNEMISADIGIAILKTGDDILFADRMDKWMSMTSAAKDKNAPYVKIATTYLRNPEYKTKMALCEQYNVSPTLVENVAEGLNKWSVSFREKVAALSGVTEKKLIELYK